MTEEKDKIKRYLASNNSWYQLMQKSIKLDGKKYPQGYHWLIAFHQLSIVTNLTKTLENLPEKHPLKSQPLPSKSIKVKLKPITEELKTLLGTVKKNRKINFSGLHFKNETDFSNFVFPLDTNFKNTKFSKDAFFNNAIFSKDVFFNNAIFCETADFEDAIFQNEDSYRKETAKFRSTVFEKIANFRNATFWGYANFKSSKLKGRAFFQKATFKWHAPRFYDATFNNEMTWAGITLPKFAEAKVDRYKKVDDEFKLDKCDECTKCTECAERAKCAKCTECAELAKCAKCTECAELAKCAKCTECAELAKCVKHYKCSKCKALIEQNRTRRIEENQNSYENTAILLAGKNKYHDQHFFFREEMRCRRELEYDPFIRLAYKLYENLADYGYGIDRAFKAWVRHVIYGFIAILIMAGISVIIQSWYGHWQGVINLADTFSCSALVSATNATPYVFIGADNGFLMNCYKGLQSLNPFIFNVIRIVQTVVGVTLLFLFLLTLRIRFRIK